MCNISYLRFQLSEPYYICVFFHDNELFREDKIRWFLYDITVHKITLNTILYQNYQTDMPLLFPTKHSCESLKTMIYSLDLLYNFIKTHKENIDITKLLNTKLKVENEEFSIDTKIIELSEMIKNEFGQKRKKLRIIHAQTTKEYIV